MTLCSVAQDPFPSPPRPKQPQEDQGFSDPYSLPQEADKARSGGGLGLGGWGKCALKGLELLTIVVSIIWVRIAGAAASPGFLS